MSTTGGRRRRRTIGALAVVLLLGALGLGEDGAGPSAAAAELRPPDSEHPVEVDTTEAAAVAATQALVRLQPGTDPVQVLREVGVDESAVVHRYGDEGFALVADDELRARLAAHDGVAGVDADGVVVALEEAPTNVVRIRGPEAHAAGFDGGTGAGRTVRVAVVDTGIDLDHPELVGNLDSALGKDCTRTGSPDDDHYHGTHVAGTVAAVADGQGVLGVAPRARLVPVKVLSASGSGQRSDVICGLEHVLALATDADPANDVQVVNMSLGGSGTSPATCDGDLYRSVICRLTAAGVTVVVSAGNDSGDAKNKVPAAFPEAVTVSAMDDLNDAMAYFSNYGAGVDVTAPGVSVNSTKLGGGYQRLSGTSMASPAVAGTVAVLLAAAEPGTPADITKLLRTTGECPDGTRAGDDEICAGQGAWSGDRDAIVEPLVDVAEPAFLIGARVRFVTPRRHAIVQGVVPVTIRTGDEPGPATVRVRVEGGAWQTATPEPGTGNHTLAWDTTTIADGSRQLEAEVTGDGDPVTLVTEVVVRNGPFPTIEAPVAGSTARAVVPVSVRVAHPTQPLESLAVVLHAPDGESTVAVPLTWDGPTGRFKGTWDSRTVGDGPRTLRVSATDAQARSADGSTSVKVDNSPAITITGPSAGQVGGSVPVTATADSPVHPPEALTLTWSAGALSGPLAPSGGGAFSGTWDTLGLVDGYVNLQVTATDPDGRRSTVARGTTVRNAPTVRLDTTTASGTAVLRATASSALHPADELTVVLNLGTRGTFPMTWDGSGFVTAAIDTRPWPEGYVSGTLTATDPDGRVATVYPSLYVKNGPTLTFLEPASSATVGGVVNVAVRVTDPDDAPATLEPRLLVDGGGTPVPLVYDAALDRHRASIDTVALSDGSHQLRVSVTDPGGRSATLSRYVTVRNTLTAEWSRPTEGTTLSSRYEVRVRISTFADPVASVQASLTVDGGAPLAMTYDASLQLHKVVVPTYDWPDGAHRLDVQVQDPRGRTVSLTRTVPFLNTPTIGVVEPAVGARLFGWPRLAVTASDANSSGWDLKVQVQAPGMGPLQLAYLGTGQYVATNFHAGALPDGPTTLTFTVTDLDGRTATATRDVVIANAPELEIVGAGGTTVDGVVPLAFRAVGPDGTDDAVDVSWVLQGGGNGYPERVVTTAAEGDWVSVLDTTPLANGRYTLTAHASAHGHTTTATRTITVRHGTTFGVGLLTPASGTDHMGIVQVVAQAWGGQLATNPSAPVSAWYRVDGGTWTHMPLWTGSTTAFELQWDTRTLSAGPHQIEVTATDWRGGQASTSARIEVLASPALTVGWPEGFGTEALDGIVLLQAELAGGSLAWDASRPVSGWYRVDGGPWTMMNGWWGHLRIDWDTATVRPGSHHLEVAATDWLGGVAFASTHVVVVERPALSVQLAAPLTGASGPATVSVSARATSATVAPKALSVFARAGTGAWATLTLGGDGSFHGSVVVPTSVPNGSIVAIEVVTIDYRGGVARTSADYRLRR